MKQKKHKKKRYSFLFFKILVGIGFPLIMLFVIFTVLTVHMELARQKQFYEIQAKLNYVTLNQEVLGLIQTKDVLDYPDQLREEIGRIESTLGIDNIDVVDIMKRSSFLTNESVTDTQFADIQTALTKKRQGISFHKVDDKKNGISYGYVPVFDKPTKRIVVLMIQNKIITLRDAFDSIAKIALMLAFAIAITALFIAIILTYRIVRPIQSINTACRKILGGNLGHQVKVNTGDELQALAANFNRMSRALLLMQRHAADSNPLTKLPGNSKIMAELDHRIKAGEKFVFFHCDIDHFKAFNDHYGLSRGDDVLRNTGELMKEVLLEFEKEGNFVGHQGGDDFVLILNPFESKRIAKRVCEAFDATLTEYYDPEALEKGYFLTKDARAQDVSVEAELKKYPLMSISLAGVSNEKTNFASHEEVLEASIEMKKKAKAIPYSNFQIEE